MDAMDSVKKDHTWNGWQEIADRHGCSISTAIRLLKSSRLPVRKPRKGTPYMLESDYLQNERENENENRNRDQGGVRMNECGYPARHGLTGVKNDIG